MSGYRNRQQDSLSFQAVIRLHPSKRWRTCVDSVWGALAFLMVFVYAVTHVLYSLGLAVDSQSLDSIAKAIYSAAWLSEKFWDGQWWRAGSYLLVHTSALHLVTNLISFALITSIAKTAFRGGGWLLVFLAAGVFAGLVQLSLGFPGAKILGASGAIAGLWGACIAAWLRYIPVPSRQLPALFHSRWITACCLGLPVVEQVATTVCATTTKTAHGAHLGGLIAGFALGLVLRLRRGSDGCSAVREV